MELHSSFAQDSNSELSHVNLDGQANGNKKGFTASTFNGTGLNNCASSTTSQNSSRSSRGFYSRLQPLGRMNCSTSYNSTSDSKTPKEPSDFKINSLFEQYKVIFYNF